MKKLLLMLCLTTQFVFCSDVIEDDILNSEELIEQALDSVIMQLAKLCSVANDKELQYRMYATSGLVPYDVVNRELSKLVDLATAFGNKAIPDGEVYDATFNMMKDLHTLFQEYGIKSEECQQLNALFENNMNLTK